eukprot:605000-Rhodomonas_salina.1
MASSIAPRRTIRSKSESAAPPPSQPHAASLPGRLACRTPPQRGGGERDGTLRGCCVRWGWGEGWMTG